MTRTRSQNGRRSRTKGHAWERDVAAIFAAIYPDRDVRRNIAQSRTAKREGADILGLPWWVECKVGATLDLRSALAQAEADSDGRPALVVAKQDRREAVVHARLRTLWRPSEAVAVDHMGPPATMRLADFLLRLEAP